MKDRVAPASSTFRCSSSSTVPVRTGPTQAPSQTVLVQSTTRSYRYTWGRLSPREVVFQRECDCEGVNADCSDEIGWLMCCRQSPEPVIEVYSEASLWYRVNLLLRLENRNSSPDFSLLAVQVLFMFLRVVFKDSLMVKTSHNLISSQ